MGSVPSHRWRPHSKGGIESDSKVRHTSTSNPRSRHMGGYLEPLVGAHFLHSLYTITSYVQKRGYKSRSATVQPCNKSRVMNGHSSLRCAWRQGSLQVTIGPILIGPIVTPTSHDR